MDTVFGMRYIRRKVCFSKQQQCLDSNLDSQDCILLNIAKRRSSLHSEERDEPVAESLMPDNMSMECGISRKRYPEKSERPKCILENSMLEANNNIIVDLRPRSHTVAGVVNNRNKMDDRSVSPLVRNHYSYENLEEASPCLVQMKANGGTTTIPLDANERARKLSSHLSKAASSTSMLPTEFQKYAQDLDGVQNPGGSCPALNRLIPAQYRRKVSKQYSVPPRKTGISFPFSIPGLRTRSQSSADEKTSWGNQTFSSSMDNLRAFGEMNRNKSDEQLWMKRRNSNEEERVPVRSHSPTSQYLERDGWRRRHLIRQRAKTFEDESEANGRRRKTHSLTPPPLHAMRFQANGETSEGDSNDILEGESEEDAAIRRAALSSRSTARRGSEVVHIPTASIRMDLHTLYLEAIGNKGKGRRSDSSPVLRRKRFLTSSQGNLLKEPNDGDERRSPWTFFRQKFGQKKLSFCDDLRDYLDHCRERSLDESCDDLEKYRHEHWRSLMSDRPDSPLTNGEDWNNNVKQKRCEAIWELFHSEVVYLLDHLTVMQDVFYKPLESAREAGFLLAVDPDTIFGNLSELTKVTTKFVRKLISIFEDQSTVDELCSTETIVKAFTEFNFDASPQYQVYCVNYSKARGYLTSLKTNEDFKEFVRWCEADIRCNRLRLSDLLVAPFQHLTKFPLLLKAIQKRTSPTDSYYGALTSAIEAAQKSIKELEGKVSFVSNVERMQQINNSIVWPSILESENKPFVPEFLKNELGQQPCHKLLDDPCRVLLHEGPVILVESSKVDLHVFLFDDMILMTKVKRGTISKSLRRRHFSVSQFEVNSFESPRINRKTTLQEPTQQLHIVYKQPIPLDRFTVYDEKHLNGNVALRNSLCLVQYNRYRQVTAVYTFQFPTSQDKAKWASCLGRAQETFEGNDGSDNEEDNKSDLCFNRQDSS